MPPLVARSMPGVVASVGRRQGSRIASLRRRASRRCRRRTSVPSSRHRSTRHPRWRRGAPGLRCQCRRSVRCTSPSYSPTTRARRHRKSNVASHCRAGRAPPTLSSGSGRPHCQNHQRARLSPGRRTRAGPVGHLHEVVHVSAARPEAAAVTRSSSGVRDAAPEQRRRPARAGRLRPTPRQVAARCRSGGRPQAVDGRDRRVSRGRCGGRRLALYPGAVTVPHHVEQLSGPGQGFGVGRSCRRAAVRWLKATSSGRPDAKARAWSAGSSVTRHRRRTPRVGDTQLGVAQPPARAPRARRARATVKAPSGELYSARAVRGSHPTRLPGRRPAVALLPSICGQTLALWAFLWMTGGVAPGCA